MSKLLVFLLIIIAIPSIYDNSRFHRSPAQYSEKQILNEIQKACDKIQDPMNVICGGYNNTKKNIKDETSKVEDYVKEKINPQIGALTAFFIKTAYEQKITLEYLTPFGKPSVSIQNSNSTFRWSIDKEF